MPVSPPPRPRRAIIVGGSMSGLFTAAFLRQIGWSADVYERSTVELAGRGAGITTHPELLDALQRSSAGTRDLGVKVKKRIALDRAGRVIGERHLPQILTSWDRLQRLLRETIDPAHYHLGWNFERVEPDDCGVRAHFSGGRVEHGDILVGGDGIRSGVRAAIMPEVQPIYAGYFIWRGTANEADLPRRVQEEIFPYFSFFLPPQQQVIGYPIAGFGNDLRPGHRRFNFIWYRVATPLQLKEMCVDRNGRPHDHSVPPPLIRQDLIASLRGEAETALPPVLADCLRAIEQPFSRQSTISSRRASRPVAWPSSAMRRPMRDRIWVSACRRRPATRSRSPMPCATTTISMRPWPNMIAFASRSARPSCATDASSARIWASTCRPMRTAPCMHGCRIRVPCWTGSPRRIFSPLIDEKRLPIVRSIGYRLVPCGLLLCDQMLGESMLAI
jgi:2-polyprenyl-6-methoxyphenol hydroxylase-like FAD-dependent oxidoreductase